MARQIDEFILAWNALSDTSGIQGWRGIPVFLAGPCSVMAGRKFPDNLEAFLAGFVNTGLPFPRNLPEGIGFSVSQAVIPDDDRIWIALTRKQSGDLQMFVEMVGDVAGAMDAVSSCGEKRILDEFLGRIKAWQEFMRRDQQALGTEAEIGLVGELILLLKLFSEGISPHYGVESWKGPLDGVQDFLLGSGAIEVKTTLSSQGFLARIGSLDQLDDSILRPIFICGVRLSLGESGQSLNELIAKVKELLTGNGSAERLFSGRLLAAGYFEFHSTQYVRRFLLSEIRFLEVERDFPRIFSGNVPHGIRRVTYEIDLDLVPGGVISLNEALKKLGEM